MKASILITCYNQSHVLPFILKNIRSQKTGFGFEVIIADDGSHQKHLEETHKTMASFAELDLLFVCQQDKGFRAARSRNNAIRLARHDVIVTLDGDIVPTDEDWLEKTLMVHTDQEQVITYSHRKYKEFSEIDLADSTLAENKNLYQIEQDIKMHMKDWQRGWSFNISFKKGPHTYFDERFHHWGLEDGEFCYRLMKHHSYTLREMSDLNMFHINEAGAPINNPFRTKKAKDMLNFINNAIYFYQKHADPEIMETFNTIPDYEQFTGSGFDLSETVLSSKQQTLENLEKQKALYESHISKGE